MENFQHGIGKVAAQMTRFKTERKQDASLVPVFKASGIEDVQGQIGLRLRAVYEAIVAEPVPDRFLPLLDSLDCSGDGKP